ncbi:MAG TPA: phage tail tip lysozyme [Polyangiaceae bacterium]
MVFAPASIRGVFAAFALSLGFVLAGCGDTGPGEPTGNSEAALNTNDKAAFDFFVAKGLTNFQSAGIVGNLDQESNVNPTAVQQGGPGRGIAQWSVGGRWDTGSNDNATAYAAKQNLSVWSLQLQLDFIWYELQTFSGYGLASLKKTTNVTDATVVFQTDFEGCGNCQQATRVSYAKAVLGAYGSIPYGAQFVSQSFPAASTTLTMTAGQVLPATIELKNTGTKAWDTNTRLGTTGPRDRKSAFADSSWVSDDRPAAVKGTVAPGSSYKFAFDLAAPTKPGTYDEHFGVVEEGVAWFSDPGQGGPSDTLLEVKIVVVASDAGVVASDAGAAEDAGATPKGDAGVVEADGGAIDPGPPEGCSIGPARGATSPWTASLGALFAVGIARRVQRRRRTRS